MSMLDRFDPDLIRLYKYFGPQKKRLVLAGIFLIGSASTSSMTATLLGQLTDVGFYKGEAWVVWAAPLALILVTLFFAVCTVMGSYTMAKAAQAVLVTLRNQLYANLLHWPSQAYQEKNSGLVSSKFVNESTIALGGAAESVIVLLRDSVQVCALLGVLFWHNWQLTLVTFVIAPALTLTLRAISKRMKVIVRDSQAMIAKMISRVNESYGAERVVKISNTYDYEDKRFDKVNMRIRRLALKTIIMESITTPMTQMLTMVAIAVVVGIALLEAQKGLLTIGEFITFLSAMLLLKAPIQHLAGLNATFAKISASAKSIFSMLDTEEEKDTGTTVIERAKGDIELQGVSLRYPGKEKDSLHNISLRIRPGEHVAFVGQSGAGKSSLVNLLPRFWEATEGRILLDGIDTRELTLMSLRAQMSVVSQDPVMMAGSIRDNIVYGGWDATEEAVDRAVEAAGLTSFVKSLPKGLDSPVGEGGSLLSGGQRQRVAIARAFLKDAPILILDEATSALDSETEAHIKEAIEKLCVGRTCITIAHRFSAIEYADRIIVMKDGGIAEQGTAEELHRINGIYANLCKLQNGGVS